jgi:hypothetical protein
MAVGSWSLTLSPDTPRSIIDSLQYFQHIVIATGRQDPRVAGNSLFSAGRYTGVITGLDFQSLKAGRGPVISGDGLATWLGTPKGVGPVIENTTTFTSAAYSTVVGTLRPAAVGAGTNYAMPVSATYTGAFVWKTPRDALTSFAQQVTQGPLPTQIAEWRVNGNCTLDFGPVASLYRTNPTVAIVAKNEGVDMQVRALPGVAELIEDVKDYTTRTVVLASGTGAATAVGAANIADVGGSNPYTDFFGNAVQMTRMISASSVSSFNATASAQAALIPYTVPADQVKLTSSEYDIKGELQVGDYAWVYDPDAGLVDFSQQIVFRGQRINPTKQRIIELTWPIVEDMTVAYRDQSGTWHDLTDYVQWETGDTTVVVGGYNRNLVPTSEPVGPRPIPDTTIPGTPAFNLPFTTTTYLSSSNGHTRAQIQLSWTTPTNTDGTTMTDLDHYEIQYRPDLTVSAVNPTWNALNSGGYTWNALNAAGGTWNQLLAPPTSQWKVTFVAGGVNTLLVQELTPGVTYDFQIRAVDTAQPPNVGAWSATTLFQASVDTIPPPTPDAPTVAAGLASVQITWDCGSASGGTFNQAADLNHIEVHGSLDPLFQPSATTKIGNVIANIGNILGQIPVVATLTLPPGQPPAQSLFIKIIAVDNSGNKSSPSASAGASAVLWSNAYITDLSVSKLTAGTITASVIMGGVIGTALSGQRVTMDSTGFHAYDANGNKIFDVSSASPVLTLGRSAANSILMDTSQTFPTIQFNNGANYGPTQSSTLAGGNLPGGIPALIATGSQYTPNNPISTNSTAQLVLGSDGGTTGLQIADVTSKVAYSGLTVASDQVRMVVTDLSGNVVGALRIGDDANFYGTGVFLDSFALAGTDLWFAGQTGGASGFSGFAISYGLTFSGLVLPVAAVLDTTGGTSTQGCYLSAASSTGFTVSWHTTTVSQVNYWAPRYAN